MKILVIENEDNDFNNIKAFLPNIAEITRYKSWDEYLDAYAKGTLSITPDSCSLVISDILTEPIPAETMPNDPIIYNQFKSRMKIIKDTTQSFDCPLIIITKLPRYALEEFFSEATREGSDIASLLSSDIEELTTRIRTSAGVIAYGPRLTETPSKISAYLAIKPYLTTKSNDRFGNQIVSFETWRNAMSKVANRCLIKKGGNI